MKIFKTILALSVLALSSQLLIAQTKGIISVTSSPTATTADYDKISQTMKDKGVWEIGWSFHAMGAAQPAGLFGIGFYTSREAYEKRAAATKPIFEAAGMKPTVQVFEVYSSAMGTIPATKPAAGIVAHFTGGNGMTAAQYDQTIVELQKIAAFPAPGLIAHFCYQTPEGLKVIDVWESAEQFTAFGEKLMPILQKMGVNSGVPVIYSLYNYLKTSN
jgi:hypothetical protein